MKNPQSFYQKLKYTLFQWFRWVSLVLRVRFGLVSVLGQIQFKESVHCWSFCAKTKILSSEHFELNHNQDTFRSRSIIIKVDHCQSSIPQPLIGLNRSQLAVRWRGPTAQLETFNYFPAEASQSPTNTIQAKSLVLKPKYDWLFRNLQPDLVETW